MIYLDNNATTRPLPEVVRAVGAGIESLWENPSSMHRAGQRVRQRVELARAAVGAMVGGRAREVTFTGSGTEANDLAIRGSLHATGRRAVVTTPVEHPAVRELMESLHERGGVEVRETPLDGDGRVDLGALASIVDDDVAIVTVQWANNETGVLQPVEQIGALCRERGVRFHTDGTQWVGKCPTDVGGFPLDLLSFSAHKFHGPKGVGALWCRSGVRLAPTLLGEQELGRRGGTENVPGILGLGAASEAAMAWLSEPSLMETGRAMRDRLEAALLDQIEGVSVNAPPDGALRLWNTCNVAFPSLEAEGLLLRLSERGLCASAGAACSSGALEASPVLLALGFDEKRAFGSVRFSVSRLTTDEEIDRAIPIVVEAVSRLRTSMPGGGGGLGEAC